MNYEECFRRGLLRYVEPSKEKSQESIKRAKEWLNEAMINFESGAFRSALLSTYLAVFHSARAVLFRDGVREKSHYCVGVYLEKYVNQNLLEEKWVVVFDRMRSTRHEDQYTFHAPTSEEVKSSIDTARQFIKRMEELLEIASDD
ncbi:HEPN domain-containing protein [Methermicoccus shengliensis]|uniref:HEPN domain-containing protein n=1 Tax=Methermicoccus shengliensis TaxID=660064 RepID=UPI000693593F|nr:HEPN domain-containing protein [Methermicoccus shengliensis]